ncbi:MAG: glycoside hydrolase family 16 protein [Myxococcota bacterium]
MDDDQRMKCYEPGGKPLEPFCYNPQLNAGPKGQYTAEYQGPDYASGGVQLGDVSVFMGLEPTTQAAEVFAENGSDSFSQCWADDAQKHLMGKLLGCNADQWSHETRPVDGAQETVCTSRFSAPVGDLPPQYDGDLKNWEYGPTEEPLFLDFSEGINGEVGMITVGNNKGGGIPNANRNNWDDNVEVVWDESLGKYVCQLDTYMVVKGKGKDAVWAIKNTGGLITTKMYASGSYEVRAKIPKASGLVWAMWTFWTAETDSDRTPDPTKHDPCADSRDFVESSSGSPLWVDRTTDPGTLLPQRGKEMPNHEIDIEIPSNSPQTVDPSHHPGKADKYDTLNMNCYRWTNGNGTGTYNNLFAHNKAGDFLGDGEYHTYRFDWHTGDPEKGIAPRVDFYFDDQYIGTNDAMVPYMAGRLWVMLWAPNNGQAGGNGSWNGVVDQSFHGTELPPEGTIARYARVLVEHVRVTPYGEANDRYASSPYDQPAMGTGQGCTDCGKKNPAGTTSILPYSTKDPHAPGGIEWIKKGAPTKS